MMLKERQLPRQETEITKDGFSFLTNTGSNTAMPICRNDFIFMKGHENIK